ncbi:MAG: tripartite tricarboxylate transporter substrate binding protein, partial [Sphaerochaeta sp.]|nr:tripartite tricarboxylate transporter substrate binding protein [Sphaerochaeta sp.]
MKKFYALSLILIAVAALAFAAPTAEVFPSRDINNILVWGAGGGTDLANRLVMAEMAKQLKVNI